MIKRLVVLGAGESGVGAAILAKQKGYDMVLRKSATLYIDPKYDVTQDVIEGLNKRYNKVAKK